MPDARRLLEPIVRWNDGSSLAEVTQDVYYAEGTSGSWSHDVLYGMREPIPGLLLDELLRQAAAQGLELTRAKLHRWRKNGLVETPQLQSLGRGRGRAAIYSADSLSQVLLIGELLKRSRDLDVARWQLFLAGSFVSMRLLRAQLQEEVERLQKLVGDARAASGTDVAGDETSEKAADKAGIRYQRRLDMKARSLAISPLGLPLREFVGRRHLRATLDLLIRLMAGTYSDEDLDDRKRLDRVLPSAATFNRPSKSDLTSFSDFFDPGPLRPILRDASDETLRFARLQYLQVVALLRRVAETIPRLGAAIALEIQRDPAWPPPFFFLLWLRHRDNPEVLHGLAILAAQFKPLDHISGRADIANE